jgi:hypothetical protein
MLDAKPSGAALKRWLATYQRAKAIARKAGAPFVFSTFWTSLRK